MKIGFQGWFLPQSYTGIGQHCMGLLRELAPKKEHQITVVVPEPVSTPGLKGLHLKVLPPKKWIPHPGLRRWYWERVQVPAFFAGLDLDWEYYPYPCPLPRYAPHLRAMTVHDMILWEDPRYQGHHLRSRYYDLARRSLVNVDHIFTVSKATHDELGIPAATLLPNGIPEIPTQLPKSPYPGALVYVGGYDIRKNVPQLVEAFAWVKKAHPDMSLVLIGKPHHQSRYYPEVPNTPGLIKAGPLEDKEVYALLKEAFAFVHFSDAEGFNIPLLQAMSVGTPVIVSDIPVNREVAGDAALYIRRTRKSDLLARMQELFDTKRRKALIEKEKARAKVFSWKVTAQIFLKTLQR